MHKCHYHSLELKHDDPAVRKNKMTRILFASSEAVPLIKTGGLADVSGSLPAALKAQGEDVRLILPAYPEAVERLGKTRVIARFSIDKNPVRLLEGTMPESGVIVWLVDSPKQFGRPGNPYVDAGGKDWPDNAERFTLFSKAIAGIAMGQGRVEWRPEVVHCNDWQTALVAALLEEKAGRPATVFSIHNLAYQGSFPGEIFSKLKLPPRLWHYSGLEYFGNLVMIKGGLAYADRITTVSPTYAREICTPLGGHGMAGLLTYRSGRLSGILNGVDYSIWDPAIDPLLPHHYSAEKMSGKAENKRVLQRRLQLPEKPDTPLLGLVSRFAEQKGIDLVLEAAPELLRQGAQLVLLGSGDGALERAARTLAKKHPQKVAVHIGYDEGLAHLIEAGADLFLMPSRFEPCGLNQLYSLRYGTLPVVRRTGGLADTVIHTDRQSLADGTATGFVFEHPTADGLIWAVKQALACYAKPACRTRVMSNAMAQDFSWDRSARQYQQIYRQAIEDATPTDVRSATPSRV